MEDTVGTGVAKIQDAPKYLGCVPVQGAKILSPSILVKTPIKLPYITPLKEI